jgi:hypothetical protein
MLRSKNYTIQIPKFLVSRCPFGGQLWRYGETASVTAESVPVDAAPGAVAGAVLHRTLRSEMVVRRSSFARRLF